VTNLKLPAPPGPFQEKFWRSPIRGPWLTSILGLVLLIGFPIMFATGLLSYAAYLPKLSTGNNETPGAGLLGDYLNWFTWPTHPIWLYRVTQGTHVTLGLMLVPIVLFKLWSVLPKLFEWPPVSSIAVILERISLVAVVGGVIFELVTGILNVQTYYPFPQGGNFYTLHFYGAWVFFAGFVMHAAIKMPTLVRSLRSRSIIEIMRTNLADTKPEPLDTGGLVALQPDPPTISRRGILAFAGGASLVVGGLAAGQSLGGPFRKFALLAPHGQEVTGDIGSAGSASPDWQVNMTARLANIDVANTTASTWTLSLNTQEVTPQTPAAIAKVNTVKTFTRADLEKLEQHTVSLPIACVEGWSTDNVTWTGVRLADLAAMAGAPNPNLGMLTRSLQKVGAFRGAVMSMEQVQDPDSLLALQGNGKDLTLDHGFPARIIVPNSPGVHCTKWVSSLTFITGEN
jgi:DMSO/TMAO reductase YedYZ molybdopterin-dependent catalytic subunit